MKSVIHPQKQIRKVQGAFQKGFLLMDAVIAMGVFVMAALGFAIALNKAADAADLVERKMQTRRILASALEEALSVPVLEEGKTEVTLEERNMTIVTEYIMMKEIENKDGGILQDMWDIKITASWYENGTIMTEQAETWRYGKLYQP